MSALNLKGIRFDYEQNPLFKDLSLTFEPGKIHVIAGPNGVGKSTLLRLMAGLRSPQAGSVHWGNTSLAEMSAQHRARTIALSCDVEEMPFAFEVLEVVLMGRAPYLGSGYLESSEDREIALQALDRVGDLNLKDRVFATLSQGEKQRVLLARALCQATPIMLLDEPTSHLDPAHTLACVRQLKQLAQDGALVVAVVHDLNLASLLADRLIFLAHGKVAADGAPDEVLLPSVIREIYGVDCQRIEGNPPSILFRPGQV